MEKLVEKIESLSSLCCLRLPNELLDKKLLKKHFSKFGNVIQVILSMKNNSCIIHFDNHQSAKNALENGKIFDGKKLHLFWSHVKSRSSTSPTGSPSSSPKEKQKERKKSKISRLRRKNIDVADVEQSSKQKRKPSKIKISAEIEEELIAMSGIDEIRPISRPSRTTKTLPSVPVLKDIDIPEPVLGSVSRVEDLNLILKRPAQTAEERYNVLEARDKLMRMKNMKPASLSVVAKNVGTCPDMCPEKERYHREAKHQVFCYEMDPRSTKQNQLMDGRLAIKQYSRSSADQDMPLPHDLRPTPVLRMTMEYMLAEIMNRVEDPSENLREWYFFLWDRTRSIRKDITQQELCDIDTVTLLEQCTRFHIFCSEYMIDEDISVFDPKINTENLTKCLQTLKYMYADMALKGEECPQKPEFQAYILLLNLNDTGRMVEELKLNLDIQTSEPIKFALSIYGALSTNNYIKFFELVRNTTYLNACILHRYFTQVRVQALFTLCRSYSFGNTKAQFSVAALTKILAFDDEEDTLSFCEYYGLQLALSGQDILLSGKSNINTSLPPPPLRRSVSLVAVKKIYSVAEVVCGGQTPGKEYYKSHTPHCSFDNDGLLVPDAYDANDQALHLRQDILRELCRDIDAEIEAREDLSNISTHLSEKDDRLASPETVSLNKTIKQDLIRIEEDKALEDISSDEDFIDNVEDNNYDGTGFGHSKDSDVPSSVTQDALIKPEEKVVEKLKIDEVSKIPEETICQLCSNIFIESTDEIIRECCARTIQEEIEKHKDRKEKEIVWLKQQKVIDDSANSLFDELLYEVGTEICKEIVLTIAKDIIYEEILYTLVDDETEELAQTFLATTREERLQEITNKIVNRRVLYYANKWRYKANKRKKQRDFLKLYSFQTSNLNLQEQADLLEVHGLTKEYDLQSQRLYSQKASIFKTFLEIPPLPNIGALEVDKIIEDELTKRLREIEQDFPDVFWKTIVSTPDMEESPHCSDLITTWTDTLFSSSPLLDEDIHLLESGVLSKTQAKTSIHSLLGTCIQRINGIPSSKHSAIRGANGVLFFLTSIMEGTDKSCRRFIKLLRSLPSQPLLPVAVIDMQQFDYMRSCLNEIWLNDIKKGKVISDFKVFRGDIKSKDSIKIMMESALKWLASKRPYLIPVHICYLQQLWEICFNDQFWSRIKWSLEDNSVFVMKQDLKSIIHIYNSAVDRLTLACLDEELLQHSFAPPEFEDYLDSLDSASQLRNGLQVCPKHWGSPQYCKLLLEVINRIRLSENIQWPPRNYVDLLKSLETYCTENELQQAIWEINRLFEDYIQGILQDGCEDLEFKEFMEVFPWINVVQILVENKLKNVDYSDTLVQGYTKRHIVITIKKAFLQGFLTTPWWFSETDLLLPDQQRRKKPDIIVAVPEKENQAQDMLEKENAKTSISPNKTHETVAKSDTKKESSSSVHRGGRYKKVLQDVSLIDTKLLHLENQQNSILKKLEKEINSDVPETPCSTAPHVSITNGNKSSPSHVFNLKQNRKSLGLTTLLEDEMQKLSARQKKILNELERSINEGAVHIAHHTMSYKPGVKGNISSPRTHINLKRCRHSRDAAVQLDSEMKTLLSRQEKMLENLEKSIDEGNFELETPEHKKVKKNHVSLF